jgi:hypothetical protein
MSAFTSPTLFLLVATALVAGLSRGFSGFGAALIFVPAASRLVGPQLAAAVLLLVDAVMAAPLIAGALRLADRKAVGLMVLGGLVGVPLGTLALAHGDPLVLRWFIVALVAGMLLLLLSGWRFRGTPHPGLTIAVGGFSGLFSGVAQIGGPPVVAYFLGGAMVAAQARASIILFFAASSVISIISYAASCLIDGQVLWLVALCAPAYGLGVWVGNRAFALASEATFRRLSYALILAAVLLGLPVWG